MTAAKKMTAYGAVVVAALVMGFALLASASAAPATADQSVTVTDQTGSTNITLTATDNIGSLGALTEGAFSIVTAPSNGTATISQGGIAPLTTALTVATTTTSTTLTVTDNSLANFPDSGFLWIDDPATAAADAVGAFTVDALDEVVSYTGKTSGTGTTTFTGVTRGVGPETAGVVHPIGHVIHPITYSTIAVSPAAAGDGSVNLLDASGFIAPVAPATATVVFLGGTAEANTYTGKTGNSLTTLADAVPPGPANPHVVGESVIQFGWTVDTGTIAYDPNAGFTGADSLVQAYSLVAANRTVSITVVSDLPVADDVEGTVSATLPTPLPIIISITGTDSSAVGDALGGGSVLTFTSLPTKGLLGAAGVPPAFVNCVTVTGAVLGEVMANCSQQLLYTPLAGATGTDTFTYTIENGGDTSAAATVTVILPGGTSTTPGAGFTTALVAGVNLTTYGGGTLAQLATDAAAANATSVSVTSGGSFLVHVVGAPDFVNAAFAANFPTDVPAGTVVLVLVSS